MKRYLLLSLIAVVAAAAAAGDAAAVYQPGDPLYVRATEICEAKPRGVGSFEAAGAGGFRRDDGPLYVYIELDNCKTEREGNLYYARLEMDVDLYYDDSDLVYSADETNYFDSKSVSAGNAAYTWAEIDISSMKAGDYKLEIVVRDVVSRKEAFTIARFSVIDKE
jgi:hypothetical protein